MIISGEYIYTCICTHTHTHANACTQTHTALEVYPSLNILFVSIASVTVQYLYLECTQVYIP